MRLTNRNIAKVPRGDLPFAADYNALIDRANQALDLLSQLGRARRIARSIARFQYVSAQAEYLVATDWDGVTVGETVNIAKVPMHRHTLASHGGVSFTYTSATLHERQADGSEDQIIVPAYDAGDELFAIRANVGVLDIAGDPIEWLELNIDARGWAAVP